MTSPPPSLTPLVFAREYQTYRAAQAAVLFPDSRLLAAVRFWSRFPENLASESYSTFWREDLPPLLATADIRQFHDLHPDELGEIAKFIDSLDIIRTDFKITEAALWELAARKWFFVGKAERALDCLTQAFNSPLSASVIASGVSSTRSGEFTERSNPVGDPCAPNGIASSAIKQERPPRNDRSGVRWTQPTNDAAEIPRMLINRLGDADPTVRDWLTRFDANWRATRESGLTNQATCVLVERDSSGKPVRGRLRTLEAHVEPLPRDRVQDEVVFGHQLCATNDPHVRGAYAALAGLRSFSPLPRSTAGEGRVREARDNAESKSPESEAFQSEIRNPKSEMALHSAFRTPHSAFRGRFTFTNAAHEPYGGDSLAFACLAAAYGDWWSKDLHRERRLVSTNLALTGALSQNGKSEAVSESSLAKKVERVFFSPLGSLVVPKSNRDAAEAEAERLHAQYPNRRLRILTIDRATDLLADGNVLIPERVCLGEYAVRAAAKYTRSLKVQVPILILLLFIAGWLGIPTARAILDRNPVTIESTKRGFKAMNQYKHAVWKREYPVDSVVNEPPFVVFDLDGDRRNEVLYFVAEDRQSPNNAKVDVFNTDGSLRFRLDPVIPGQYPGDYDVKEPYSAGMLHVAVVNGRPIIVTGANAQNPSRFHIKTWSAAGDSLGWYVNAGVIPSPLLVRDFDFDGVDDLVLPAYNIRMRAVSLVVLRATGSFGVSPPYWDEQYDLSRVTPGNQLHYMIFPVTDLTLGNRLYNNHGGIHDVSSAGFRFDVLEGGVRNEQGKEKFWSVNYYIDSTLHIARVDVDDSFKVRREALVRSDSLPAIPWPEYFRRLRDTATYWTREGWISHRDLVDTNLRMQ